MSTINLRLRQLRRQKNMSQEELAQKLGVSRQAIIAIEQGNSLPSLPVIIAILRVLDIPFDSLLNPSWNPFRPYSPVTEDEPTSDLTVFDTNQVNTRIPIQITEDSNTIYVLAELAGVHEEDLTVDMSPQHVLIMANKKKPDFAAGCMSHAQEIYYGQLMRIISLPSPIDTQAAQAEFRRGILRLSLPKFLPDTKRRITFKETTDGSK